MNIVRVRTSDGPRYAREDGSSLHLFDKAPWLLGQETGVVVPAGEPLVPVEPAKIICVGRNYRAHAQEMGHDVPKEPLLFLKPSSALSAGPIALPRHSERVEHEAELGVVIGTDGGIFGLTCVNDVSARDWQKKDNQWARAKGADTFCPVGPRVVTGLDWRGLDIVCRVNGSVRQRGNTRDMIFGVPEILAYIGEAMTLEPGDLVVTGTPEGVGPLQAGDVCEVEIAGIGVLLSAVSLRGIGPAE